MSIRTLLIEDEAVSARYLQRLLGEIAEIEMIGVARDGEEGVEAINRLRPELIFLDIELPKLSGFEVLQRIQHKPLVVFLTAHGEYRGMANESDAVAFLCKPVDAEQIRGVVEKIRRMKRLLRGTEPANGSRGSS